MTTTTELIELIDGLRNNGDDCKCCVRGFSECGCSANWSELHAEEAADLLEAQAKQIEAFTGVDRINVDLHAKVQALQAKLSAIEAQEPVAWANPHDLPNFDMKVRTCGSPLHTIPLYAAPVAPAQLVNELVEALECLIATHWPLEEATTSDGCYTDDPNEIKARKALANAERVPLSDAQICAIEREVAL
jgi:hypothetical protein